MLPAVSTSPLPKFSEATQRRRRVKPRAVSELRPAWRLARLEALTLADDFDNAYLVNDLAAGVVRVFVGCEVVAVCCAWSDE